MRSAEVIATRLALTIRLCAELVGVDPAVSRDKGNALLRARMLLQLLLLSTLKAPRAG